jgi:hypothetical protein
MGTKKIRPCLKRVHLDLENVCGTGKKTREQLIVKVLAPLDHFADCGVASLAYAALFLETQYKYRSLYTYALLAWRMQHLGVASVYSGL